MAHRDHITLLYSFYETAQKFPSMEEVGVYFMAICRYGFEGQKPEDLPYAVDIAFGLIQPILDSSRRKAEAGSKGGSAKSPSMPEAKTTPASIVFESIPEANSEQTQSKQIASSKHKNDTSEATSKQSESKREADSELKAITGETPSKQTASDVEAPGRHPVSVLPVSLAKPASEYEYEGDRDGENEDERETTPPYSPPKGQTAREAIRHLNDLAGTRFSPASKHTLRNIERLLAQGYGKEDLVAVIDHRYGLWQRGGCVKEQMRPEILFGSEFGTFLEAASAETCKEASYRDYD